MILRMFRLARDRRAYYVELSRSRIMARKKYDKIYRNIVNADSVQIKIPNVFLLFPHFEILPREHMMKKKYISKLIEVKMRENLR